MQYVENRHRTHFAVDRSFYDAIKIWGGHMIAPGEFRRGKSEHHRARWFVTRTAGNRRKVPQKIYRRWPAKRRVQVRLKWRGKSSPLLWRHKRHGKPHRVQDQIEKRLRAARLKLPGRSHEAPGNRRPSQMIMPCSRRDRIRLTARPNPF